VGFHPEIQSKEIYCMEITFDILKQIPRLIKELLEIVQSPGEKRHERRATFFNTEIAPIHESMKAIHQDYMAAFTELLELLEAGSTIPRTIELLKKRRLVLVTTRQDMAAYSTTIKDIQRRGYLRNREVAALHDYAEGIRKYFQGASPVDMRVSWYSAFIDEFESLVRRGVSPFSLSGFDSIVSNGSPVSLVRRAYAEALHHDLPQAWKEYSEAFQHLGLELRR
jgi:hypothetical protein